MKGHTSSPRAPICTAVGPPVSLQKTLFQAASLVLRFEIGYGINVIHDLAELLRLAHSAEE